jgi:hypothetical protein
MEKYLIQSTFNVLEDTPLVTQKQENIVLGVIGGSKAGFWTKQTIQKNIVERLVKQFGKKPDMILLPNDGNTSIFIEIWAQKQEIPVAVYNADWIKLGRRARAIRDARIQKEATHLLYFLGNRSDYYENAAIREVKKGKEVYSVDSDSHELSQVDLE